MNRQVEQDSFVNQTLMGEMAALPQRQEPGEKGANIKRFRINDGVAYIAITLILYIVIGAIVIHADMENDVYYGKLSARELSRSLPGASNISFIGRIDGRCSYFVDLPERKAVKVELECSKKADRCSVKFD